MTPWGSSPLTRGKQRRTMNGLSPWRLIPAHAGKTRRRPARRPVMPAHPRSRGENCAIALLAAHATGSSPLTRGKPDRRSRRPRRPGLIPAHAGKTIRFRRRAHSPEAHPRSRGENHRAPFGESRRSGSSPLTRGKPASSFFLLVGFGLIPAHAGKTSLTCSLTPPPRAHPRSRGENQAYLAATITTTGSSPLTRGKRGRRAASAGGEGLIPAHAGKTPGVRTR